jgi:hypothetical protein
MANQDVDFVVEANDAEVKELLKFPRVKDGYYRARLEDIATAIAPRGGLQLAVSYRLLSDPDDINSVIGNRHRVWVGLPISPKSHSEQTDDERQDVSRALNPAGNWLAAHAPKKYFGMPRRTDEGTIYNGEILTDNEIGPTKLRAGQAIVRACAELWNSKAARDELLGTACYFAVKNKVSDKTGKSYANTNDFAAEADPNQALCNGPDGMFEVPDDPDLNADVPEIKPAPKKKAAAKKGKK